MTDETRTIPVELDRALYRGLEALAELDGMDGQDVLRRLLVEELQARSRPVPRAGWRFDGTEAGR